MRYVERDDGSSTLELNDGDIRYFLSQGEAFVSLQLSRAEDDLRRLRQNSPKPLEHEPGTDPLATYCVRMQVLSELPAAEREVARLRKQEEEYRRALGY